MSAAQSASHPTLEWQSWASSQCFATKRTFSDHHEVLSEPQLSNVLTRRAQLPCPLHQSVPLRSHPSPQLVDLSGGLVDLEPETRNAFLLFLEECSRKDMYNYKGTRQQPSSKLPDRLDSMRDSPKERSLTPYCRNCSREMDWSSFDDGAYASGWECNHFETCGSQASNTGPARWFCRDCSSDICARCFATNNSEASHCGTNYTTYRTMTSRPQLPRPLHASDPLPCNPGLQLSEAFGDLEPETRHAFLSVLVSEGFPT